MQISVLARTSWSLLKTCNHTRENIQINLKKRNQTAEANVNEDPRVTFLLLPVPRILTLDFSIFSLLCLLREDSSVTWKRHRRPPYDGFHHLSRNDPPPQIPILKLGVWQSFQVQSTCFSQTLRPKSPPATIFPGQRSFRGSDLSGIHIW